MAILLPNGPAFPVALWGAWRAGAVVTPANPLYTVPELAYQFADADVRLVVTAPALVKTARRAAGDGVDVAGFDGLPDGAGEVRDRPAVAGDLAVLCYTSGTTGRPKGARLRHANFLANLAGVAALPRLPVSEDDVLLGVLPFFHIFGLNAILGLAAYTGCSVLVAGGFSPRRTWEDAAAAGVTVAFGAPPMFAAWNALPAEERCPAPALRAGVSGADALPVATWERFVAQTGVTILEGYGLTETAPVLTSNAASPATRPGTVGHPIAGVDLRIVGPDGRDTSTGGVGEIWARGSSVFDGYHARPEDTAAAFEAGWFKTGDLGAVDRDGYLRIAGRLKEMVIVSGFNVYPREVEEALRDNPSVADAAVVGVPDERTGERVRAFVVAAPGTHLDADGVIAHARERLARYKLPREVRIVEALPRTALGKVRRAALRDVGVQ